MVIFFLLSMNYQIGSFRYLWDNRASARRVSNNDMAPSGPMRGAT